MNKNTHECTVILNQIINEICLKFIPPRGKNSSKRNIPRVRKNLIGRLKRLRRKIRKSCNKEKIEELNKRIVETDRLLIEARRVEKLEKEAAIVVSLPKNPKLLFSYAKKRK